MDGKLKTYKFYEAKSSKSNVMEKDRYHLKEVVLIVSQLIKYEKIEIFLFYNYEFKVQVYLDLNKSLYVDIEGIIESFVTQSMFDIMKELFLLEKLNKSIDNIIQFEISKTSRDFFGELIHFNPNVIKELYSKTKNNEMKSLLYLIAITQQISLS